MEQVLHHLVVFSALMASLAFYIYAQRGNHLWQQAAYIATGFCLVMSSLSLGREIRDHHYLPLEDPSLLMVLFAFFIMLLFLILSYRFRFAVSGVFVMPLVFLGTAARLVLPEVEANLPQELRSPLFGLHIALIVWAFSAFFLSACAAGLYLILEQSLKHKRQGRVFERFPSLSALLQMRRISIAWGLLIFSLGLLVSAFWSYQLYARPLIWQDPRTLASLITWVLYALLYLSIRKSLLMPRQSALATIAALLLVLATLFGASHFFPAGGA